MYNAAKGKKKYKEVMNIMKNVEYYVDKLHDMLVNDTFVPSPYRVDLKRTEYGKEREIFKLPFYPDRVVQHCIAIIMKERWYKSLTYDTYACLKGRGINCKNSNFDVVKKLKNILINHPNETVYCLKMDIKKCYPSVDNDILREFNRRYLKDKRLLALIDRINDNCIGLPIGNYLSQLQINIYLSPLDRFIKQQLNIKYYFRYMDDIVILGNSKQDLHQIEHRIMNFCWYMLKLIMGKRQIFKIGNDKYHKSIDFVGYNFYRDFTKIRKRVKKMFYKRKNKPKSVSSYTGMTQHCDATNLVNNILNKQNMFNIKDFQLDKIKTNKYKKLQIQHIIDKPIVILDYKIVKSKFNTNDECLMLYYMYDNIKRFACGGFPMLIKILKQVDKDKMPFEATIKFHGGYYFASTIE